MRYVTLHQATTGALRLLAAAHETLYRAVTAPCNGYDRAAIMLHSPEEVCALLAV